MRNVTAECPCPQGAAWRLAPGQGAAAQLSQRVPGQPGSAGVPLALLRAALCRSAWPFEPPARAGLPAPAVPMAAPAPPGCGQHVQYNLYLFLCWCRLSRDLLNKAICRVFTGRLATSRRSSFPPQRPRRPMAAPAERAGGGCTDSALSFTWTSETF